MNKQKRVGYKATNMFLIGSMALAGSPLAVLSNLMPVSAYSNTSYFSDSQIESGEVTNIKFLNSKLTYFYNVDGKGYTITVDITPSDLQIISQSTASELNIEIEGPNSASNGKFRTKLSRSDLLFGESDLDIALESADMENINDLINIALENKQATSSQSSGYGQSGTSTSSTTSKSNSSDVITQEEADKLYEEYGGFVSKNPPGANEDTDENSTGEETVKEGDTYVLKAVEKSSNKIIKKAKFKHTLPDGTTEILSADSNGEVTVKDMESGVHTFQMTSVPKGYKLNDSLYRVKVDESGKAEKVDNTTQRINIRYENVDGSFSSYSIALDDNYKYGDEVEWSRSEDEIYEAASVSYKVDGSKTTNVDIKRKRNTIKIGDQLDNETASQATFKWSGTINGQQVSGQGSFSQEVCVGSTVDITIVPLNGYSLANGEVHIKGTVKAGDNLDASFDQNIKTTSNSYNITFDSNGGSSVGNKTVKYNQTIGDLPTPTQKGYTFVGWYSDPETGYPVSDTQTMDSKDVTYYAHWKINSHTVKLDANGGDSVKNVTKNYGDKILEGLPEPTRTGYTFKGWYTAAKGGQKISDTNTLGDEDIQLYAHWEINKYAVFFDATGGIDPSYLYLDYNSKLGELPTTTRDGYVFDGWYTEKDGGIPISADTLVGAETKTYYAHWTAITYTATFDSAGGSTVGNKTFTVEDEVSIENPTREGYTFTGWTGSNGSNPQTDLKISRGTIGDVSYTANWKKNGKNFQEFVDSHYGKGYARGYNSPNGNAYGYQCVAGFNEYMYWGNGHATSDNNAWPIGANWRAYVGDCCTEVSFDEVRNGDILFWSNNGYGHVGMYYNGTVFGQNQGSGANLVNGTPFNFFNVFAYYGRPAVVLRPNFIAN